MKFVKNVYSCASISTRASENCLTGEWQKKNNNNNNNSNKDPLLIGGLSTLQTFVAKTATFRCEQKLSQPITANKITEWINQMWKQISVKRGKIRGTDAKRGKIRARKTRMVLFLLLIGRDNGTIILTNHRAK